MENKRFAIFATIENDESLRVRMETDELTTEDLKVMGFAVVGSVAEAVAEQLETPDEVDKFFNALINKLEDMREN